MSPGLAFPIAVASIALEHLLRVPAATISRNGLVTSNDEPMSDDASKTSSVKATATSTSAALAADLLGLGWIALGFAHLLLLRFSGPNGSGHCLFLLLVVWQVRWQRVGRKWGIHQGRKECEFFVYMHERQDF